MRRWLAAAVAVGSLAAALALRGRATPRDQWNAAVMLRPYLTGLDSLDSALATLDDALGARDGTAGTTAGGTRARDAFRAARTAYKRIELYAEYYEPRVAREMNGPPLPRTEEADPDTPLRPIGFQMIEAELYLAPRGKGLTRARVLTRGLRADVAQLRRRGADTIPGDAYVFDAMRHELARVTTLGLAGFDATLSGDVSREAAAALEGVRLALGPYRRRGTPHAAAALARFDRRADSALAYLRTHADLAHLDRLQFIAFQARPLAQALAEVRDGLGIGVPSPRRALAARASDIYDRGAIDPMFFAPLDAPAPTAALVALGRSLFFDPILSSERDRSCASCHDPSRAFTDGLARAVLLPGHERARARGTPTLVNAALQPTMFADARAHTLEDQAADVIGSGGEMGGTMRTAARVVGADAAYRARFAAVFGARSDSAVTARRIGYALAAYVRSLRALDSRFDRAVRGDTAALSAEERRGFELFMGKAACGTCHFAPLFNGATPPMLLESEPEVIGVPAAMPAGEARIDPDSGAFVVSRIVQQRYAFRTPTLRNVALTAPYMHNGVLRTLDEVVDFYDRGGGAGLGIRLPNQTLPAERLDLAPLEQRALVAFLHALTDTSFEQSAPR